MTTTLQSQIASSSSEGPAGVKADRPSGAEPARQLSERLGSRLAMSVTEAADLLGISRALAYELVARGDLPSVRLGRRLVVPRVALLAMFGVSGPDAA